MSEQEKCHAQVNYTSDCGTVCSHDKLVSQEEIEPVCRDSKSVRILQEFRQIYEERLRKIDQDNGGKGMEVKLKTLTSWINDLGEQNLMLVETVEQLEREAAGRVALLEERLKKSSHAALEYMSKLEEYDTQILDLSEGKSLPPVQPTKNSNKLVQAQQTEEILRTRVSNLQNDISSLLELIRRARCDGTWDTNGLTFLEVTYEDIFGSYPFQVDSGTSKVIDYSLMASIDSAFSKPNTNSSVNQAMEISILTRNLEDAKFQLQKTMQENEQLVKEIEFLSAEMKRKTEKIASLSQNLSEVEKIVKHTRESKSTEVARKNNQIIALRNNVHKLEKCIHEADVQTKIKDAIVKEMRKDLRIAHMKLSSQECCQTWCIHLDESDEYPSVPHSGIPDSSNKIRFLLHNINQACKTSRSVPCDCQSTLIDKNHSSIIMETAEKKLEKNDKITCCQRAKVSFHQSINNCSNLTSHKHSHNQKEMREQIKKKTISNKHVQKDPKRKFTLREDDHKIVRNPTISEPTNSIDLLKNADYMECMKSKVIDKIKQKFNSNNVNCDHFVIHKCARKENCAN